MITICVLLVITAVSGVQSRKEFTPSALARELRSKNVSSWEIPWLVCIANHTSSLVTGYTQASLWPFVSPELHYGLFRIPDRLMSGHGRCQGFNKTLALDDNPEDDVRCILESLDATQPPRLKVLNKLLDQSISVSQCLDYWKQLPPCFSSENATNLPCVDTKPLECSDYSGYFTFLLSTILILTLLAIIYLSSQIAKPINKPETLGTVSLTISRK